MESKGESDFRKRKKAKNHLKKLRRKIIKFPVFRVRKNLEMNE